MKLNSTQRADGFTLIEIMMAMGIFALALTAIYATWSLILKASKGGLAAAAPKPFWLKRLPPLVTFCTAKFSRLNVVIVPLCGSLTSPSWASESIPIPCDEIDSEVEAITSGSRPLG